MLRDSEVKKFWDRNQEEKLPKYANESKTHMSDATEIPG